jgi:hypothetical protein
MQSRAFATIEKCRSRAQSSFNNSDLTSTQTSLEHLEESKTGCGKNKEGISVCDDLSSLNYKMDNIKIADSKSSDESDLIDFEEQKIDVTELLVGVDSVTKSQLLALRSELSCDSKFKGPCVICQLGFSNKVV